MILRVPYSGFPQAMAEHLKTNVVYGLFDNVRTLLTAGESDSRMVILSRTEATVDAIRADLAQAGLELREGVWSIDDDFEFLSLPYIAAIAYKAAGGKKGLWLEAYPTEPGAEDPVLDMLEEFQAAGIASGVTVEQFKTSAEPELRVISPVQIAEFLERRRQKPAR